MTLKQYLIFMSVATLFAWIVFGLIILFTNPEESSALVHLAFYMSTFVALLGTFTLGGIFVRIKVLRNDSFILRKVGTSVRQSFLFSFLLTSALYLQSKSLLVWWNVLFLILALSILELFFISYRRR